MTFRTKFALTVLLLTCTGCARVGTRDLTSTPTVSVNNGQMQLAIPHPRMMSGTWVAPQVRRHGNVLFITGRWTVRELPWQYNYDLAELGIGEDDLDELIVQWVGPDGTEIQLYPLADGAIAGDQATDAPCLEIHDKECPD